MPNNSTGKRKRSTSLPSKRKTRRIASPVKTRSTIDNDIHLYQEVDENEVGHIIHILPNNQTGMKTYEIVWEKDKDGKNTKTKFAKLVWKYGDDDIIGGLKKRRTSKKRRSTKK